MHIKLALLLPKAMICGAGCNSLRISIEWALIEPKRGTYDHWAVQRYHDIFKEIIA